MIKQIKNCIFNKKENAVAANIVSGQIPQHIAIIMDGNGRWSKKRHIPRNMGHKEGADTLKKIVLFCEKIGLKYLTVYAFSTENWKRPKDEVDALMKLLMEFLTSFSKEINKENIKIKMLGDITALPEEMQNEIIRVENETSGNSGLHFNVALNYGGRDEIVHMVKSICRQVKTGKLSEADITEKMVSENMYTSEMPDPDLLIRTSGEYRLSNFLLWQLAYSELCFDDVLWPDFNERHLMKAIHDYQKRERRFGGL